MIKYLLASHMDFSVGTLNFLEFMIGERTSIYTLMAFKDNKSIEECVEDKLKELGDYEQLIIFCDIYGGSVQQELFRQTYGNKKVKIIAGYNLAIVMEIIMKDQIMNDIDIKASIEQAKSSLVYINDTQLDIEEDLF